jgi:leader peptidase (prepilin peptidase)/N-methyltransferase
MQLTLISPLFSWLLIFISGAMLGSFLNVVIYRLPKTLLTLHPEEEDEEAEALPPHVLRRLLWSLQYVGADILWMLLYLVREFPGELFVSIKAISYPPSSCGNCQKPIAWYDNLPILGWFLLRGKCRKCQVPYSFRYPFNEFLCGCLFISIFMLTGWHSDLVFLLIFACLLWVIFWIDLDHQFIFNVTSYPSIFLGIIYNASKGSLTHALWGILTGLLVFELIVIVSIVVLQKEGMGGGDIRLAMALGAWLGPQKLTVALALAFIIGSIVGLCLLMLKKESKPFSFGPALVTGGLLSMHIGENLWTWYINSINGNTLMGLL